MRLCLLLVALVCWQAQADIYMHNPPGSNDRNRERSDNRNNGDRLFDSQNNGQGGYAWRGDSTFKAKPDPLTYYTGSFLRVEWTAQHACGPNFNSECQIVIQYGVTDPIVSTIPSGNVWMSDIIGARDGYPTSETMSTDDGGNGLVYQRRQFAVNGAGNTEGTGTIPAPAQIADAQEGAFYYLGANGGVEYGMHESGDFYTMCSNTERNKGLYHSDQQINGNSARNTRQNPNGNRRGLECPEERDYYPWWNPSPWRDAAILVSNTDKYCNYFKAQSENVKPRYYCDCSTAFRNSNGGVAPINEQQCRSKTGNWVAAPSRNLAAPECLLHPFSRDNHLGNTMITSADGSKAIQDLPTPTTASYSWKIPADAAGKLVVLRVRYNISTNDYPSTYAEDQSTGIGVGYDASKDCPRINQNNGDVDDYKPTVTQNAQCMGKLTETAVPLYNRPYVDVFGANARFAGTPKLSLAINTHQTGRTFQDRTHVFKVEDPPAGISGDIVNLNVRGRRGNIVQCYPAVEYDFVPNPLYINDKTWVHVQIHGSNFNAAKDANNGEGWRFSDRHNIVQYSSKGGNYPLPLSKMTMFGGDADLAKRWALLDQEKIITCLPFQEGDTNEQNAKQNCGKLNAAPERFPPTAAEGLLRFPGSSEPYYYASTRDNNFSNRSLKGTMYVESTGTNTAVIVGAVLGSIAGVCLLGGAVLFYGKKHPNTRAGAAYTRVANLFSRKAKPAPDMEYQRS